MYRNLSEFIARLEREGELQRVSVPVDPVYEIAEITDRMSKQPDGGKALLFEHEKLRPRDRGKRAGCPASGQRKRPGIAGTDLCRVKPPVGDA